MARTYDRVYNQDSKDELIAKGEPVDSGISPTAFPTDFKNKFVARLKDTNIDPKKKSFGGFSDGDRYFYATQKIPLIDDIPNFSDPLKNSIAKNFLGKYRSSFIIPDEDKASAASTLGYISGNPNSNLRGSFPGGMEVS